MLKKLEHQLHKYENQKLVSYEIEIGFKQDEKDGPVSTLNHNTS